ncbi:hypothetical protein ONS95_005150 [Cadophora gregata]|uniref:uncharacterized protein n=1 Tax=Cadophora gregata TaxID=51156 RepID=UPI0026DC96D8|nr:uncharacterized protein ONS95_005150 [Cadophora gregata]KAK0104884.1 hypothetical protein ONS95_005150 [Cadophora gregata]KAK0115036.1 hypothetical protein ONS96_013506 [Cadophora gregata f. sp. sojae]
MKVTLYSFLFSALALATTGEVIFCTTTNYQAPVTIVVPQTSTYCPVCDVAKTQGGVYTTTYATVYPSICDTGLTEATYTVTQTCTGLTPINPAVVPPQFTAVTTVCTPCAGKPTLTITQPYPAVPTGVQGPGGAAYTTNTAIGVPAGPTAAPTYPLVISSSASSVSPSGWAILGLFFWLLAH